MDKKYLINNKEYIIPKETTYLQYKKIKDILSKLQITDIKTVSDDNNLSININLMSIVSELFDKDLIPQLLATLLIPAEEKSWSVKLYEENYENMFSVTDTIVFEVLENFLLDKVSLIQNMMNYLENSPLKKTD